MHSHIFSNATSSFPETWIPLIASKSKRSTNRFWFAECEQLLAYKLVGLGSKWGYKNEQMNYLPEYF